MASLLSYGICQTACNAAVVSCYAAAGFAFGTVTAGASTPAVILACNTAQGACMATCAAKFLAEGAAETAASGGLLGPMIGLGGAVLASGSVATFALRQGMFGRRAQTVADDAVATVGGAANAVGSAVVGTGATLWAIGTGLFGGSAAAGGTAAAGTSAAATSAGAAGSAATAAVLGNVARFALIPLGAAAVGAATVASAAWVVYSARKSRRARRRLRQITSGLTQPPQADGVAVAHAGAFPTEIWVTAESNSEPMKVVNIFEGKIGVVLHGTYTLMDLNEITVAKACDAGVPQVVIA